MKVKRLATARRNPKRSREIYSPLYSPISKSSSAIGFPPVSYRWSFKVLID